MIGIGRYNLLVGKSGGNEGWWKYAASAVVLFGVVWWAAIGSQVSGLLRVCSEVCVRTVLLWCVCKRFVAPTDDRMWM
mgnify:CR=1 FL=1